LTAALLGAGLGAVGQELASVLPALMPPLRVVLLCVATLYAFAEWIGRPLPVPQRTWQVPKGWGYVGPLGYSFAFGAVLATGVLTRIPYFGVHLMLGMAVLSSTPFLAAAALALFGAARAAPAALSAVLAATRHVDVALTTTQLAGLVEAENPRVSCARILLLLVAAGSLMPSGAM
jgi:hypothetical protein